MDPKTVSRVRASTWSPAGEGSYAVRIIMWKREDGTGHPDGKHPYCSHIEVEDTRQGTRPFYHGNYDMTWEEAQADFTERCRQHSVQEGGVI